MSIRYIGLLLIIMAGACIDPINLTSSSYESNLVIEGFLSTDNQVQEIRISRSAPINSIYLIPELGATVSVTDDSGPTIAFTEGSTGRYTAITSGTIGHTYTLKVVLSNGNSYESDPVKLRKTPPISSISARYIVNAPNTSDGIHFYVSTTDPDNEARYFRWTYQSTFEIQTPFPSNFVWLGGNDVVYRDVPVNRCWAKDSSKNVLVSGANGSLEAKVTEFPLLIVPPESFQMRIRYSLLVKQYTLTSEGYLFWNRLRQINTTQGSLADLQPGTVVGNIHSTSDAQEVVLGYFDAAEVTSTRRFVSPSDFQNDGYRPPGYLTSCNNLVPYEVLSDEIGNFMYEFGILNNLLISESSGSYPAILSLRPRYCCDCTNKGTNIKPPYWP